MLALGRVGLIPVLGPAMKWFAPPESHGSLLGRFIAYPIGKLLLRLLTIGKYPPEEAKHNYLFVMLFPWVLFVVLAVIIYR
jgi:hypothetical protein